MIMTMDTKRISASEFKARCLELMDEVARTGEEIVITKRGRPVSRLCPVAPRPKDIFGLHAGQVTMRDDLVEPTGERWDAGG